MANVDIVIGTGTPLGHKISKIVIQVLKQKVKRVYQNCFFYNMCRDLKISLFANDRKTPSYFSLWCISFIILLSDVIRAFPGGRLAHPED